MPKDFDIFLSSLFFDPHYLESEEISMHYAKDYGSVLSLNLYGVDVIMEAFGLRFHEAFNVDEKHAIDIYKDDRGRSFVIKYVIGNVNIVPSKKKNIDSESVLTLAMHIKPTIMVFEKNGHPEYLDLAVFVECYKKNVFKNVVNAIMANTKLEKSLEKNKDSYVI